MNCRECWEYLQQQLDGDLRAWPETFDAHLAGCAECRELSVAALRLAEGLRLTRLPQPPADLTLRIVRHVLADRRARRRQRVLAVAALAASLLLAVTAGYATLRPSAPANDSLARIGPPPPEPVAPSLQESVEEAGLAMADLTRRTMNETVGPTRTLLPSVVPLPAEEVLLVPPEALEPSARSLREVSQSVSAGLEPVASSARRAVNLFLRDIPPMDPQRKPGL